MFWGLPVTLGAILLFGVTSGGVIPDQPFNIIWHTVSQKCLPRYGIDLNLRKWGILDNKYDGWHGEYITLMGTFNIWPQFAGNKTINGGIPQLGNVTYFTEELTKQLESNLPANFSGLAVFDIEIYRPLYHYNFDYKIYQKQSQALVRKQHPTWNKTQVAAQAEQDFDIASRHFWKGALDLGKKLRPNGRFGYYGIPYGFSNKTMTENKVQIKDLSWLYRASGGLFPSCYIRHYADPAIEKYKKIGTLMNKTRIARDFDSPHTPIYPYIHTPVQEMPFYIYSLTDLMVNIGLAADMGLEGVLMWSGHWGQGSKQNCQEMKIYIDGVLGVYAEYVLNFTKDCSTTVCSGHGRCALKSIPYLNASVTAILDVFNQVIHPKAKVSGSQLQEVLTVLSPRLMEVYTQKHDVTKSEVTNLYQCLCDKGFSGDKCQTKSEQEIIKVNNVRNSDKLIVQV